VKRGQGWISFAGLPEFQNQVLAETGYRYTDNDVELVE